MIIPELFWNPLSITWLIEAVLALVIACNFVARLVRGMKAGNIVYIDVLLTLTFIGATIAAGLQLLSAALPAVPGNYVLPWAGPLAAFSVASFVLFCFNLNRPQNSSKLVHALLFTCLAIYFLADVYVAVERHFLLNQGIVEYRQNWLPVPIGTTFILCPIFLAWSFFRWQRRNESGWREKSIWAHFVTLLLPLELNDKEASKIRAFFLSSLIPFLIGVVLFARSQGFIDWTTALVVACWLYLLFLATFALAYLNYVPEQTSFRTKLSGISLTGLLCVMCGVSWLVGPIFLEEYENTADLKSNSLIAFHPLPNNSYQYSRPAFVFNNNLGTLITDLSAPLKLPFSFPYFDQNYETIFLHQSGMVGFSSIPRKQDILFNHGPQSALSLVGIDMESATHLPADAKGRASGVFAYTSPQLVTITWNRLSSKAAPSDFYTYQLHLYADGRIAFAYKEMPKPPQPNLLDLDANVAVTGIIPPLADRSLAQLDFGSQDNFTTKPFQGVVDDRKVNLLSYLSRFFSPLTNFTLGASIVVLVIFPWFFTINFNRSLQDLLQGVNQIVSGNLKTRIDVRYRDEVGYLAASFNEMAEAQNELVQNLERKVAERTVEIERISARNARLEERNWLSQELHDAVSQTLFSANLLADSLPDLVASKAKGALDTSTEIKKLNSEALEEMRELLFELRNNSPDPKPFSMVLNAITKNEAAKYPFKIDLDIDGDFPLRNEVHHTFFRVLQEGLANAAKHANANNVNISFHSSEDRIVLSIADDGGGFEPETVGHDHLGVQIMKERMSRIGGTCNIHSDPGAGTQVLAEWQSSSKMPY